VTKDPPMTNSDRAQLWLVGFALVFILTVVLAGQSQEAINATLVERMAGITLRLDRIDNYQTATIVALVSNLIAHIISIRSNRKSK